MDSSVQFLEKNYVYLVDLEITLSSRYVVMVRVARKWPSNDLFGSVKGFNFIVIDECHKRMHLWVDCEDIANAEELFEVGKNYKIEDFIVEPFIGRYRCMNEDKHIVLTAAIQVLHLPDT
ncbi:hypothetical protein AgCh_012320 [Apium graveolens]